MRRQDVIRVAGQARHCPDSLPAGRRAHLHCYHHHGYLYVSSDSTATRAFPAATGKILGCSWQREAGTDERLNW